MKQQQGDESFASSLSDDRTHEEGNASGNDFQRPTGPVEDSHRLVGSVPGDDDDDIERVTASSNTNGESAKPIKLYKSSRLKGYITLSLSSVINYTAAQKSSDVVSANAIPASEAQRKYAVAVSSLSMGIAGAALLVHLDRVTPLEKVWVAVFKPKSRVELCINVFLVIWWSIAIGIETSITGLAGDGKEQYNLYYSAWTCCLASFWILDRWMVDAGFSSLKAFISSWPYRAPGWLCIFFMDFFTFIWYLDLWKNYSKLGGSPQEENLERQFVDVQNGVWQMLIVVTVFTLLPAIFFVVIEIVRETKSDGSTGEKGRLENVVEGVCLLLLVVAWVPTIIIATTPGGPAALVGNSYFFSWILVVFIAETCVWFVHDMRQALHRSLRQKQWEYELKQREVFREAQALQIESKSESSDDDDDDDNETRDEDIPQNPRQRADTKYFDAAMDNTTNN